MCLSMLYLQFLCGGGQRLLQRQSDRLLASRSQRSESKLSGHDHIMGNFERFNFRGCMIFVLNFCGHTHSRPLCIV